LAYGLIRVEIIVTVPERCDGSLLFVVDPENVDGPGFSFVRIAGMVQNEKELFVAVPFLAFLASFVPYDTVFTTTRWVGVTGQNRSEMD
jgi:hypothetical protein